MDFGDDYSHSDGSDHYEEDDGYSHSDGSDHYEEDDGMEELPDEDSQETEIKEYTDITEADVRRHQEDAVAEVCPLFSVSRVSAVLLLLHHNWSVDKLQQAWFADEEAVRKAVGLLKSPPPTSSISNTENCGICFDSYSFGDLTSANCGHHYCKQCWRSYIAATVENGPGCLTMRCPEPSCGAAVGQDMIHSLANKEDKTKYDDYLARSYVELNRNTKWCPAPGCEKALVVDGSGYDVYCECSNGFCWNCEEEAHSPMDCKTVNKWITKNTSEAENTTWIIANTKPCPKCRKPIEKNQGCMHMRCRPPCNFSFCWVCLRGLDGNHSGACNGYQVSRGGGMGGRNEEERRRELAKKAIEKYAHYYERWAANDKAWKKAKEDLGLIQKEKLEKISVRLSKPVTALGFIVEAWKQVVECRRVLKWTYAYGYYLAENEKNKKRFFEYVQGEAEVGLERLHKLAEKDMVELLLNDDDEEGVSEDTYGRFRMNLVDLTRVTCKYFGKLVKALENGLEDVKGDAPWWADESYQQECWACDRCTFMNPMSANVCQVCVIP